MTKQPAPRRGRVRLTGWQQVAHGLYAPAESNPLAAWQLVLPPSGAFTHLTAAQAYGWWLPPLPAGLPVFACQSADEPRPRRPGLRVTRHLGLLETVSRRGFVLAPPVEVILACARDLTLLDLVVIIDAALHLKFCRLAELHLIAGSGRPGSRNLRRALLYVDRRSESAWESMLRMLHVACDVPVLPQHELAGPNGVAIARADLWLMGTNAIHEYDGHHHLKRRRQRTDLGRGRRLANSGIVRRGYTSAEVLGQAHLILRDADLSLGREHVPDRVRRWYRWLEESLFTKTGRERFMNRVSGRTGGQRRQV